MMQNGTVAKSDNSTGRKWPWLACWPVLKKLDRFFDDQPSISEITGRLYRSLFDFIRTHAVWGGIILYKPFECY
jgi:hypothetical protein